MVTRTKTALAFLAGILLILAFSCCTAQRNSTYPIVPNMGGPGWRVLDADRIDTLEALPVLMRAHNDAQNCSKSFRPFNDAEIYAASKIIVKTRTDWTDQISGLTIDNRIYIKRDLQPSVMLWTLKHEFVHYVTEGSHPDIDETMKVCGVHYDR